MVGYDGLAFSPKGAFQRDARLTSDDGDVFADESTTATGNRFSPGWVGVGFVGGTFFGALPQIERLVSPIQRSAGFFHRALTSVMARSPSDSRISLQNQHDQQPDKRLMYCWRAPKDTLVDGMGPLQNGGDWRSHSVGKAP